MKRCYNVTAQEKQGDLMRILNLKQTTFIGSTSPKEKMKREIETLWLYRVLVFALSSTEMSMVDKSVQGMYPFFGTFLFRGGNIVIMQGFDTMNGLSAHQLWLLKFARNVKPMRQKFLFPIYKMIFFLNSALLPSSWNTGKHPAGNMYFCMWHKAHNLKNCV